MIATKIVFNGREYGSVEEMPAEVRRAYEEAMRQLAPAMGGADRNGVPDLLEGKGPLRVTAKVHTRFVINGREYVSVEEMPADVRRTYEQALAAQGGSPAQIGTSAQIARRGLSLLLRAAARSLDPGGGARSSAADAGTLSVGARPSDPDATPIAAGSGLSASEILLRLAAAAALALVASWILEAL